MLLRKKKEITIYSFTIQTGTSENRLEKCATIIQVEAV